MNLLIGWNCIRLLLLLQGVKAIMTVSATPGDTTYDEESSLRSNLTASYEQSVRPDIPTVISTFYSLRTLKSLDIAEEKMGTVGWLTLVWEDPRLSWNPADYAGIDTLEMTTAWRPNFFIANELKESSSFGFTTTDPVRVYNTGTVRWLVPLNIETGCDVDIAQFPFDSQTCSIDFIYWITSKEETVVTKVASVEKVNIEFYHEHGEWELQDTKDELEDFDICCPDETVQRNIITLQFKRRRPYYIINILIPTLLMSVCVIWTFILPTPSGERIGYSLTILLSYTVFLTVTSDLLPSTSKQTPTFATYLLVVLVLSLLSVSLTVWNVKFYNLEDKPPKRLQKIFHKLKRIVFCECRKRRENNGDTPCASSLVKVQPFKEVDVVMFDSRDEPDGYVDSHAEITWKVISEVLDRIYFFIFLAAIGILNTALMGSLVNENTGPLQLS